MEGKYVYTTIAIVAMWVAVLFVGYLRLNAYPDSLRDPSGTIQG